MRTFLGVHYPPTGRRNGLDVFLDAGAAGVVTYECGYGGLEGLFYATRFQSNGADNPPNFYTDPLKAAQDHFNGQQEKWADNPGALARLSNNELDIETPWHGQQQVIFDLEFMRLCESVGEHAGICNYAGGNPSDNPLVDGTPCSCEERWRSVLPAIKYAGEHNHFVVLHIHQQDKGPMESPGGQSVSLRHRRAIAYWLNNAEHPECVITKPPRIIFNEVSNGVGGVEPNEDAYYNSVTWLDQQCRNDVYNSLYTVLCLYQAGGTEPISETMYNRLAAYISAQSEIVINPLPGGEPMAPFPLCGLHSPASAGDITPIELAAIDEVNRFASYKFQSGDAFPAHYDAIAAHGIPLASCFMRLSMDMQNRPKPTPEQYVNDMSRAITEARSKGIRFFEIHNEPNIQEVEWPWSNDPHDFITWLMGDATEPGVIRRLRTMFTNPNIGLISPGLAPAANTQVWWNEFADHGVFAAVEGIGAHVYWPNRATMLTQAQGLNFIPLVQYSSMTKPIIITELSNNINGDSDYDKGVQYIDWCSFVAAHYPTVTRSYWYVLSSNTPADNDNRQTLVRNGAITQIADGMRDGVYNPVPPAPPPPDKKFGHYHLDNGAADSTNPISITMNSAHTLLIDSAPVVVRYPLTISNPDNLAYTVTPASPDGMYEQGTIVRVQTT